LPFELLDDKPGGRYDIMSDEGFCNTIHMCLRVKPGSVNVFAPVCSSWVWVNRGTSGRSEARPLGRWWLPSVANGNGMVTRVIVLLLIIHVRGGLFVIEQPASSLMHRHPRFQYLMSILSVFKAFVYMGSFGAPSEKPTHLYANDRCIHELEGRPRPARERMSHRGLVIKRYKNRHGQPCITGGPKLKSSQAYPKGFGEAMVKMWKSNQDRLIRKSKSMAKKLDLMPGVPVELFKKARGAHDVWLDGNFQSVLASLCRV